MLLRRINYWLSAVITTIFLMGLFGTSLLAQHKQELVVTIEPISSSDKLIHFAKAETLRTQMNFREAIAEYQQVIAPGDPCGKEAEAHYDIGLCYLWLVKLDTAATVFHEVMKTYPDSNEVIAFSHYGLSWIDVQRGKFQDAIDRLQQTLNQNLYPEKEFCARVQFQIGRIYLVFLHDYAKADQAFRKVLEKYPDSEIINHPFLEKLKGQ
jgi:tetratricopeptide (TPR) repeat protein